MRCTPRVFPRFSSRHTPKKTLNKIVRKGHDYVAQVKGNSKELLKWVDYNSSISEPIDEHITYDIILMEDMKREFVKFTMTFIKLRMIGTVLNVLLKLLLRHSLMENTPKKPIVISLV